MRATNEGTGHNRTIRISGIQPGYAGQPHPKDLVELTIVVNYKAGLGSQAGEVGKRADGSGDYLGDGEKAVCLDNAIIPYIIDAINRSIPDHAVCLFQDGNKICCVRGNFVNLQESLAGFGDTYADAQADLFRQEAARQESLNATLGLGTK